MRKALSVLAACLVCVCVFFVGSAKANPGAYVGDDGGASWSCGSTEAGYGKMIYGYGDEGLKWYRCVHKDWTFDNQTLLSGRYFWQHNGAWPYYHYEGSNAWEGQ